MYKTSGQAREFIRKLKELTGDIKGVEIAVCPPFTALYAVAGEIEGSNIAVGAQNMHWEEEGAFTGEISFMMLKEIGCRYVILGHSERRQFFSETDQVVNKKLKAALKGGLTPILCVGEVLEERKAGITQRIVSGQLQGSLEGLSPGEIAQIVIAYEPVWAIGTGLTASPQDAQQVNGFIRDLLAEKAGQNIADKIRILYGGSVKPDNITLLSAQPDIDGALVGGASLQPDTFAAVIKGSDPGTERSK